MRALPKKIKPDSIIEALLEIRFITADSDKLPEMVVWKLASNPAWTAYSRSRLGIADLPADIRAQDPNVRFSPTLELRSAAPQRTVRIGPNVVSLHVLAPYPGGDQFEQEAEELIRYLYGACQDMVVARMGLRYVNLLSELEHGIGSKNDLNFQLSIGGAQVNDELVIRVSKALGPDHVGATAIASPGMVQGQIMKRFSAMVDVDISTPNDFAQKQITCDNALKWMRQAHIYEREEFFHLLTDKTIAELGVF